MEVFDESLHLNEFTRTHLKAYRENSYYTLIDGDRNYENEFRKANYLYEIYYLFINGIKLSNGNLLKLPPDDIIGFYIVNKEDGNANEEDIKFISNIINNNNRETINKIILDSRVKITALKQNARIIGDIINNYMNKILSYEPVKYEIIENNEEKRYKLKIKNGNTIRLINESDTLDIFDILEPNKKYPVIIYSNPNCEYRYKCSNNPVDFTTDALVKNSFPPNSLILVSKKCEFIIIDFIESSTTIMTNPNKINNDKFNKISNYLDMFIFEEEKSIKKIVGKIDFNVNKVPSIYGLYNWLITDPIASTIFYNDETDSAWCSKDNMYIFFRDFSNEMIDGTNIKTIDSYFRFYPLSKKESLSGFTISFMTKNKDMIPSFIHKFSRLFSHFLSLDIVQEVKITSEIKKTKIYIKLFDALKEMAGEYFKINSNERKEKKDIPNSDRYSRTCQSILQPIIIKEDEIEEWRMYGREPHVFPPVEWNLGPEYTKNIWFVCPKETYPIIKFNENRQDVLKKIKTLPCCSKGGKQMTKTNVNIQTNITSRTGITDMINTLNGNYGTLNDELATFLSISYNKDGKTKFRKKGTIISNEEFTFLNSSIIALLIATNKLVILNNIYEIMENVNKVKQAMAMLPTDIYRQELYDLSDVEIIESILNPNTFIDPYLYYRGLEIIFDVQIFTFTSDKGRINPLSDLEDSFPLSSLEIPRCKYTHIRNYNNTKDIVCLYKNYGSSLNSLNDIPSCELISAHQNDSHIKLDKISYLVTSFAESLFNLLDKCCHPIEWEFTSNLKIGNSCYDNPYTTINWSKYDLSSIGILRGQEVDIYGKTSSLLFDNWTIVIPPTQPFLFVEYDDDGKLKTNDIKIKNDNKIISFNVYSSGTKRRAPLKTLKEAMDTFDVTEIDDDCVWIEFNGNKRGLKIPCISKNNLELTHNINSSYELINRKNNLSILFQIINWLWRSDYDENTKSFPNFIEWWSNHAVIDDSIIFTNNPKPLKNCNNYMLPKRSNFDERLKEMTKLWPFYFYNKKIHVSKELFERTANFFNVEDIYSKGMTPNDIYGEPGRFITDLIPTDDDFKSNKSIILNKIEHINNWIIQNNSSVFKYKSLYNTTIIREKLTSNLKKMKDYYVYRETEGDNEGQIYIIQNSLIPSNPPELTSLQIANHWKVHSINPGPEYYKEDDHEFMKDIKYVIYKINSHGILEPSEDRSNGGIDYLQILDYEDKTYGAMLPLMIGDSVE
jgi:hypothetical protein